MEIKEILATTQELVEEDVEEDKEENHVAAKEPIRVEIEENLVVT